MLSKVNSRKSLVLPPVNQSLIKLQPTFLLSETHQKTNSVQYSSQHAPEVRGYYSKKSLDLASAYGSGRGGENPIEVYRRRIQLRRSMNNSTVIR
jgi:hypothetical protein